MRRLLSCLLTAALLVSVSGCASKYGTQQTVVNYYPACYDPIKKLRDSEQAVNRQTAGGAAVGALGGALLGLLVTGKAEGAVVGAVAGGATGAVAGNMIAKKQQIADDNRRMASYLQDLEGDISGLDIVSTSARTSLQCYNKQFRMLVKDIKSKRVTRQQAERMFAEIQSGTQEAVNLLGTAETNGRDMERQYREALTQEEQKISVASTPAPAAKHPRTRKTGKDSASSSLRQAQNRTGDLHKRVESIAEEKTAAERQAEAQSHELAEALASSQV